MMLDISNPSTDIIFQAATIEDKIRADLLGMQTAKGSAELIGRQENICLVLIPKLLTLNQQHFNDSIKIRNRLIELKIAVEKLQHETAWQLFVSFADTPGDNFGTWAI